MDAMEKMDNSMGMNRRDQKFLPCYEIRIVINHEIRDMFFSLLNCSGFFWILFKKNRLQR